MNTSIHLPKKTYTISLILIDKYKFQKIVIENMKTYCKIKIRYKHNHTNSQNHSYGIQQISVLVLATLEVGINSLLTNWLSGITGYHF